MNEQPAKKRRIRVGVVFGGRSGEHEVSLRSAKSILDALDPSKYEAVPLGITREGGWVLGSDPMAALTDGKMTATGAAAFLADPAQRGLVAFDAAKPGALERAEADSPIDVVFPVLHGTYGEDGTIQGMLEMANVPYVGAGVLGSAVSMDKGVMKTLLRAAGLPILDWIAFTTKDWAARREQIAVDVEAKLGYPCFVKPANLGSSVGISKVDDESELGPAVELAGSYDTKVVAEQAAVDCREVEVSVLGNDDPQASLPGEVIPDREWYDYDAKYSNSLTQLIIPAQLPPEAIVEVRRLGVETFKACQCHGMARVDFFVSRDADRIWVNELNTIPGFTSISMYPKLWEATGVSYRELVDRLIQLAIERHEERSRLRVDR
jgi:D-alanine-D-alanine ligase